MTDTQRNILYFAGIAALIIGTGFVQSWNAALFVLNFGLISAIMALGVNLQWGFAGLFNVGIMGFVALGGLATVLISMPPEPEAWAAGGLRVVTALILGAATIVGAILAYGALPAGRIRTLGMVAILVVGFFVYRAVFDAGVQAVEAVNPANAGYLGGLNLPVLVAWPVGGLLAAGAAWVIGKTALGLRSDYLAIATLGIAEIVIAVMKNEDWLARGVKNVVGLPRPAPYEIDLQNDPSFVERVGHMAGIRRHAGSQGAGGKPHRLPDGRRYTIIRPSNPVGLHQIQSVGVHGLFPSVLDAILHGRPVRIFGDGTTVRDYFAVEDLARLVLAADADGLAEAGDGVWAEVPMPTCPDLVSPILYAVPAQLLAYHTAVAKGTDVDQPRNLAKSVTVE